MIWASFKKGACLRGHACAIQSDGGQTSYSEILQRVDALAKTIGRDRIAGGSRVLLAQTEPLALLLSVLACWSIGLVPVISREGRSSEGLADLQKSLERATLSENKTKFANCDTQICAGQFQPRDEALVICTSGTTGSPKLVALSAESVLINIQTIASKLSLQSNDLVAVVTPLTYMYGLFGGTLSTLWAGATVRLFALDAPPPVVLRAVRSEGVSVIQGPPSLWRLFFAYWNGKAFPGVRLVTIGGESTESNLMDQLGIAFPHATRVLLYGMTEAGPRISHRTYGMVSENCNVVGTPFEHLDWYIDPIEQGCLPAGTGRLVLRGPTVFMGYIQDDGGYTGLDTDGYFHSNDLVRIDPQGQMHFVDRFDRIFKSRGKLVSPNEVEAVLLEYAAIKEAACHKEPHEIFGFVLAAQIVLHDDANVSISQIRAHCAVSLQPHSIPKRFDFLDSFPNSNSGKRQPQPTTKAWM